MPSPVTITVAQEVPPNKVDKVPERLQHRVR
jgi:hypothetical protein